MMASSAVSPAPLSQEPGPRMRVPSSVGAVSVPAEKTVSMWAEMRMYGSAALGEASSPESVSFLVEVDVGEAKGGETLEEPLRAG